MKKKAIIISSIIVCLLIAGGITFLALNKSPKNETTDPHTTTVVDQAAWDETVVDKIEYTYCSECGAEK